MSTRSTAFAARWRAAVRNLQLGTERVQATADALPPHVTLADGRGPCPGLAVLLRRHEQALGDHAVALACVQALLREYDVAMP